ncbi:preprotein translocase subunit YajC [Nocardioides gilvus]|uniref:preprotein translocase subunit YajC n=1 Tax=Nocardioides gilvus TaxID=1735589 RepID=UPI000D747023|nr:preprotein translocase subunit YajC [Nocardioides gilvus]
MNEIAGLWPFLAVLVIFWLMIIRPAQRQRKQTAALQSNLAVGDRVMLTSGIFATVVELLDDRVRVQVAEGVVIDVVRAAVGAVESPQPPVDADDPES